MERPRRTAALAVGIVAALGATAPAANADAPQTIKRVTVVSGHTLRVALRAPQAGSTGYHWNVSTFAPGSLLRRTSNRFVGSNQVFTYRAGRPGATRLRFRYVPPGRGARAVKTHDLYVSVNRPAHRIRCYPAGSRTVISNGRVRVFTIRRSVLVAINSRDVFHYNAYYGCGFRRDRAHPLDNSGALGFGWSSSDNVGDNFYSRVTLNGDVAGYLFRKDCPFGQPSGGCADILPQAIVSQNLVTGRVIRRVYPAGAPFNFDINGFVLSARGGFAWLEFEGHDINSVHRSDRPARPGRRVAHENQVLDDGTHGFVDPDSLYAEGNGFRWKNRGIRRHASLR
jgi:hypothetical protein